MASGSVAEIKSRLAVADVVGETVQLRKAGAAFKGLCPFHGEKTPSFVVTPARETWKCFGCGKGGDIFTFVMERDSLPFGEALALLAAKAGVTIDDRSRAEDARKARLREVLEGTAARLAAQHASEVELSILEELCGQYKAAVDDSAARLTHATAIVAPRSARREMAITNASPRAWARYPWRWYPWRWCP